VVQAGKEAMQKATAFCIITLIVGGSYYDCSKVILDFFDGIRFYSRGCFCTDTGIL